MSWVGGIIAWVAGGWKKPLEVVAAPPPQIFPATTPQALPAVIAVTQTADHRIDFIAERSRRAANQCTLWPVRNSDRRRKLWCGPTVVSTLIGIDAAIARDLIKESRGGRAVMGTSARELDLVFRAHGCRLDLVADHSEAPPTLATWLRMPRDPDHALVVHITGHWVAVRGNWFCDTATKGQPVKVRHAPHKRKRVRGVFRVTRL